jgi:hypothetical protein
MTLMAAYYSLHGGFDLLLEYGDRTTQVNGTGGMAGGGLVVAIGYNAT